MGTKSVIHFPALPLYSGRTAKSVGMIFHMVNEVHHHYLYLPYFDNTKIYLKRQQLEGEETQKTTGLIRRATSITIINKVKKKCRECAAWPIQ